MGVFKRSYVYQIISTNTGKNLPFKLDLKGFYYLIPYTLIFRLKVNSKSKCQLILLSILLYLLCTLFLVYFIKSVAT